MSGYVVTRPYHESGVGSNLASLAGALWLAQQLQRSLLIDWRGQAELADKRLNYFAEFLSLPTEIGGAQIVPARAGDAPFAPNGSSVRWLEPAEARSIAMGEVRVTEEYIALETYHGLDRLHPGPESERFRLVRALYSMLRPLPEVAAAVDEWVETRFSESSFVIGLNVRTGNGGRDFAAGGQYARRVDTGMFRDEERFLRLLQRACMRVVCQLPRPLRTSYRVFCTTDSTTMSALLSRLPNAMTRRTVFPPAGVDHAYAFTGRDYTDRDGVVDTLADLFLLARCDGLVYNSSLFNQYARVVTGCFGGSQVHFESLLLRKRGRFALQRLHRAQQRLITR